MTHISFGAISFPEELIDKLLANNLVIFCGAGVSVGEPSNLPSFDKLADEIAESFGLERDAKFPIDRYLGRLKRQHKENIYPKVINRLENSEPNNLHTNIIRLFSRSKIKIVTTNFDTLFEKAAEKLNIEIETFCAPALPLGKDFEGLIHLHGSIKKRNSIVLTDDDFGRAYLTEGWARRLLIDLFQNYSVLFIGYSHNDPIVEYLSSALLPEDTDKEKIMGNRYALCKINESDKWEARGIEPIVFQEYNDVNSGVSEIVDFIERGAIGHLQEIKLYASSPPPKTATETNRLNYLINANPNQFRVLLDNAKSENYLEWLEWLDNNYYLDCLIAASHQSIKNEERDIDGYRLSYWIAKNYIQHHSDAIISILSRDKFRLSDSFIRSIILVFGDSQPDDSYLISNQIIQKWIPILIFTLERYSKDSTFFLSWLGEICGKRKLIKEISEIFLSLVRTNSERRIYLSHFEPTPKIIFDCPQIFSSGDSMCDHHFKEYWKNHLHPNITIVAPLICKKLIYYLEEIYENSNGRDEYEEYYRWETLKYSEQNFRHAAIDALINAIKNSMIELSKIDSKLFHLCLSNLLSSHVIFLNKVAISCMAFSKQDDFNANQKFEWLLDSINVGKWQLKPEINDFFQENYSDASPEIRKIAVDNVCQEIKRQEPEFAEGGIFELLNPLSKENPDCDVLNNILKPLLREHPEMINWDSDSNKHKSTIWKNESNLISAEDILNKEPKDCWSDLFYKDSFRNQNVPHIKVKIACQQSSSWAIASAELAIQKKCQNVVFWNYVLNGLSEADLSTNEIEKILELISSSIFFEDPLSSLVVVFLENLINKNNQVEITKFIPAIQKISSNIWTKSTEIEHTSNSHWLSRAINHQAGKSVLIWIQCLSLKKNHSENKTMKIPVDYCQFFNQVVEDETIKGGLGRTILCSQLGFLFGFDNDWAKQKLISLFTHEDPMKVKQAWDGFLIWGRLYPDLARHLFDAHKYAIEKNIFNQDNEERERFIRSYIASLVVFRSMRYEEPDMQFFLKNLSDNDHVIFAFYIKRILQDNEIKVIEKSWNGWLKKYWEKRIENKSHIGKDEMRHVIDCLSHLDKLYPAGVEIALQLPLHELTDLEYHCIYTQIKLPESVYLQKAHLNATANLLSAVCRHCEYHNLLRAMQNFKNNYQNDIDANVLNELREVLAKEGLD